MSKKQGNVISTKMYACFFFFFEEWFFLVMYKIIQIFVQEKKTKHTKA